MCGAWIGMYLFPNLSRMCLECDTKEIGSDSTILPTFLFQAGITSFALHHLLKVWHPYRGGDLYCIFLHVSRESARIFFRTKQEYDRKLIRTSSLLTLAFGLLSSFPFSFLPQKEKQKNSPWQLTVNSLQLTMTVVCCPLTFKRDFSKAARDDNDSDS